MLSEIIERLIHFWKITYFTNALVQAFAITGLIVTIAKWKKKSKYNLFVFLFAGFILSQVIGTIDIATNLKHHLLLGLVFLYTDILNTVIEIFIFVFVIKSSFNNSRFSKVTSVLPYVFLLYTLVILFSQPNTRSLQPLLQNMFTLQACMLLIPCTFYYIELLTSKPVTPLSNQPLFWIVTGLTFCLLCTLPFSILGQYIVRSNIVLYLQLFSIYNIFYCILFAMIIKSFYANAR